MSNQLLDRLECKDQAADLGLGGVPHRTIADHQSGEALNPVISIQPNETATVAYE
ncbi:hypothetical protein D3C81_2319970 [compost metagenome]